MTNYTILTLSIVSILMVFNCQAEAIRPVDAISEPLTFHSSLSKFNSINTEINKSFTDEIASETVDMEELDHSKMDHRKMGADEMNGMNHDNMTPEQMKEMSKATAKPIKQKKLKSIQQKNKPAQVPADAHQNHQM